ncbi:MAG: cytochrome P450 [Myxococcota bacterium]|nr:cytochrome P450 [Myxococcota bacterium]
MSGAAADRAELDLYDPDAYVEAPPYARFAELRRRDPVCWQPLPDGGGAWWLLKHADVKAASADPATFSAARGGIVIEELPEESLRMVRSQLLAMDPPEHGVMRRKVLAGFTPGMVGRMEPWLRARAGAILDAAAARERCDLVTDLASALPLQVICEILGVPEADRPRVVELGDRIIGRDDRDLSDSAEQASQASVELGTYGYELAMARRGSGGGDLVSVLLDARAVGDRVDPVEFAGLFVQIIVAGNETTRTLLSGGVLALMERSEAWRRLADEPGRIPVAVEELLRWVTPVHYFRRTATRDVTLRGRRIREGDRVVLSYTSANRDEEVFDEPERFDPGRDPNPHLAFGWGEHFCLGAKLARLEARVFLEELFRRVEALVPDGPPRRMRSNLNNAWKSIPVRVVPR